MTGIFDCNVGRGAASVLVRARPSGALQKPEKNHDQPEAERHWVRRYGMRLCEDGDGGVPLRRPMRLPRALQVWQRLHLRDEASIAHASESTGTRFGSRP